MYDFLQGKVERISPTDLILDVNGVGYAIHISLHTFERVKSERELKLYVNLVVREDSHSLYGFATLEERELFLKLINVNGVGTATARMILSALSVDEVISAITNGNVGVLKSVKGIGPKAAQRLIVELQDKLGGIGSETAYDLNSGGSNMEEAAEALVALGFSRPAVNKTLLKINKDSGNNLSTEEFIKKSLQIL
ncbi:Holliday junction branch migration protein RuvA [bacterium]|nr:Holliday junction branch migration protein RuvA [bacterium]